MRSFIIKALGVNLLACGLVIISGNAALAAYNGSAQATSQNQQSPNQQNQNQQNQATDGTQNNHPADNQSANPPDKHTPDANAPDKNNPGSNSQTPDSTTTNTNTTTNEDQPGVPDSSVVPNNGTLNNTVPVAATIPGGTAIFIRTVETLDSGQTQVNTVFHGTTTSDIYVGNQVVIPSGTNVEGKVTRVQDAAHFAGKSLLALQLTKIVLGGQSYDILTNEWSRYGRDRSRDSANKIGGSVFIGTVIGAATGGGRGAVIGAGIGATAGAAIQGATRGQQVHLDPERVISFKLQNPLSLGAPPNSNTNQQPLNNDDPYDE